MNRILELAGVLNEGAEGTLYIADPYGNGYSRKAVTKGTVLTRENGNFVDFEAIHPDMKHVYVMWGGKKIKVTLADIGGKILPAGQKANKAFFESIEELSEAAGGKKQGAVNMVLATLSWGQGGTLTMDQVRKALSTAYDAGFDDAQK